MELSMGLNLVKPSLKGFAQNKNCHSFKKLNSYDIKHAPNRYMSSIMGKMTMGVSKNGMLAFEGIPIFEMLASFFTLYKCMYKCTMKKWINLYKLVKWMWTWWKGKANFNNLAKQMIFHNMHNTTPLPNVVIYHINLVPKLVWWQGA